MHPHTNFQNDSQFQGSNEILHQRSITQFHASLPSCAIIGHCRTYPVVVQGNGDAFTDFALGWMLETKSINTIITSDIWGQRDPPLKGFNTKPALKSLLYQTYMFMLLMCITLVGGLSYQCSMYTFILVNVYIYTHTHTHRVHYNSDTVKMYSQIYMSACIYVYLYIHIWI